MLAELLIDEVFGVLLVFVRVGSALLIMPGLAEAYVLRRWRLLFALALGAVLAAPLAARLPSLPDDPLSLGQLLAGEFLIGLFIGAAARMIFSALHVAGTAMAFQSGLAAAAIFDPNEATQGTVPGNFLTTTALVLLFVTEGHHVIIQALAASYIGLPATAGPPLGDFAEVLIRLLDHAFALAIRIAAPIILVSALMYLGMGILNRLMPSFQVFFIALPLQLLLTFTVIMLTFTGGLLAFFIAFEDGLATVTGAGSP